MRDDRFTLMKVSVFLRRRRRTRVGSTISFNLVPLQFCNLVSSRSGTFQATRHAEMTGYFAAFTALEKRRNNKFFPFTLCILKLAMKD